MNMATTTAQASKQANDVGKVKEFKLETFFCCAQQTRNCEARKEIETLNS